MNKSYDNSYKTNIYKQIGNRLLECRKELNYTQEQLAEMLGIGTAYYGKIERGEKCPSIERMILINEKLGMDLTYLITGKVSEDTKEARYFEKCPTDKRDYMEQLLKIALKLTENN